MSPPRKLAVIERSSCRRALAVLLFGLISGAAFSAGALAQGAPVSLPDPSNRFGADISVAAQHFGVPAAWIRAVIGEESGGNARAVSPKGALGLMQIMPKTWTELSTRHRLGDDPFDPHDNILAGAAYLRELHDRYGSPGFLAAYNAGPARYEDYLAGRPLPAETLAYVDALAPTLVAAAGSSIMGEIPADPRAWTRAPLFIARGNTTAAAFSLPAEHRATGVAGAASGRSPVPDIAPSHDLFVAPTGPGASR